jgi:tRNA threonylcarbamoyladenosine biosynthesis protein TsaB
VTLLAIDTSTAAASIALVRADSLIAELTWQVGQRHSSELMPHLSWLLDAHSVAPADLTGMAVALGPGSFNGVRVAVAAAKAMAFALRVPLVGVATLDCIAWSGHLAERPIWALLDAGRGQLYTASYRGPAEDPIGWKPRDGYLLLTPDQLAERVEREGESVIFCGEWRAETQAQLERTLGAHARFTPSVEGRRAVWLGELALARMAAGQYDDPAAIEPLYMRRPAITTSAKVKLSHHARYEDGMPGGEGR